MPIKTFAPGLRVIVNQLCRYVTRYRAQIEATLRLVITDPTDLAAVLALLNAVVAACGVLNKYFPPEAS